MNATATMYKYLKIYQLLQCFSEAFDQEESKSNPRTDYIYDFKPVFNKPPKTLATKQEYQQQRITAMHPLFIQKNSPQSF